MSKSPVYEAQADLQWCGQSFSAGDEVTGDALAALLPYGDRFAALRKPAPVATPTPKASGPTTEKEA